MNAQELTKYFYKHDNEIVALKKQVEYLEAELKKLRLLMQDLQIDVQMLQKK